MRFAKYELKNGAILKDGHTMFLEDVVRDLNRKSQLEEEKVSAPNSESAPCEKCGSPMMTVIHCSNDGCLFDDRD